MLKLQLQFVVYIKRKKSPVIHLNVYVVSVLNDRHGLRSLFHDRGLTLQRLNNVGQQEIQMFFSKPYFTKTIVWILSQNKQTNK